MDPIRFAVQAPADDLSGLVRTLSLLRGINAYLVSINTGFAGLRQVTLPERSVESFAEQIKQLADKLTPTAFVRGTKATALVDQLLGPEAKVAFERQIESFRTRFKDAFRGESFADPGSAAKVARTLNEQVRTDQFRDARRLRQMLSEAGQSPLTTHPKLSPQGAAGPVAATIAGGTIGLSVGADRVTVVLGPGPIPLTIPADRIQAVLGPGTVITSMDQLRAAVGGPGGAPAAASAVAGRPTRPGTTTVPLDAAGLVMGNDPAEDTAEIQRRIRRTAKNARTSITRSVDEWTKITETFDEQGEKRVSDEVRNRAKASANRIRAGVASAQEATARAEATGTGLNPVQQLQWRAEMLRQQSQRISEAVEAEAEVLRQTGQSALLSRSRAQALRDVVAANRLDQRAVTMEQAQRKAATRETLAAVARGARDQAATLRRAEAADREMVQTATRTRRGRSRIEAAAARAQEEADRKAREAFGEEQSAAAAALSAQAGRARANELLKPDSGYRRTRRSTNDAFRRTGGFSGVETLVFEREDGGTKYIETIKLARRNNQDFAASVERTERALRATRREAGAAGRNFIQNTQQVTTWATSVGVLYGAIGLLRSGINSFIEQSYQIQRLGVVFSGVGGTAQMLANDVSKLAVANGRSTEEALSSAIAWSRLGLTRKQVAEAVRLSLVAANVAEIDAAQATENLQGVYQSYRMEVGQLAGTLAQLNEVSNTTNATVGELFDGLSRVAPAAAQAGVPLRTLVGYLGQMVAQTKQSGANIGNALKTFVGRLSTPDMLRQIRDDFGVQVSDETGQQKEFLGILDAVYVRYQQLTEAEKNALLVRVAGNTQLNRLSALMDGYIRAQVLAINTQLRLNSAESENEKIRETLRNRLQGLVSEMQRFAQIQGGNGPGQALGGVAEALQNLLKVLNMPYINMGFTLLIGLMGVLGARAIITKARLDAMAGTPGFMARSFAAVSGIIKNLGNDLTRLKTQMAGVSRSPVRLSLVGQTPPPGVVTGATGATGAISLAGAGAAGMRAIAGLQRVLTGLFATLGRFLGWIGLITAAGFAFNQAMEWVGQSSTSADEAITSLTQALEVADAQVNATADSIRLLDTVLRLLPSASAEARQQILKDLGDLPEDIGLSAEDIRRGGADPLAAVSAVQSARERAYTAQVAAQQVSFVRARQVVRRIEQEVARLENAFSPDPTLISQKASELEQARGRVMQQRVRVRETIESDGGDGDTGEEARRKYAEIVDARASVIRSIFNDAAADGPNQRLRAQIEAERAVLVSLQGNRETDQSNRAREYGRTERIRAEAARLQEQARTLREEIAADGMEAAKERDNPWRRAASLAYPAYGLALESKALTTRDQLDARLREATGLEEQAATLQAREQSPELRQIDARLEVTGSKIREAEAKLRQLEATTDLTAAQETLEKSRRTAAQSLIPFAYGRSETESIQRQLAAAERLLAASGKGPAPLEELGRRESLLAEMGRLRDEQNRREVEVQREINSLIEERTREFQRQVALASPAELLRTLAAIQTTQQGLTAGRFLAAGDLRTKITELPGFGSQERSLAREASLIASIRNPANAGQVSAELAQVQALIGRALSKVGTVGVDSSISAEITTASRELGVFAGALNAGTTAVGKLASAVGRVENQMDALASRMTRMAGAAVRNPQAGGLAGGLSL